MFVRSLQSANTSNNQGGNGSSPIVGLILLFVVICVCASIFRAFKSDGTNRSSTERAGLSVTNGTVEVQQTQEQSQPHVNAHLGIEILSKGLDRQKVEQQLIVTPYIAEDDSSLSHEDCSICLSSFKQGDSVSRSVNPECTHRFHTDCIVDWLIAHPACPECRRDFLNPNP